MLSTTNLRLAMELSCLAAALKDHIKIERTKEIINGYEEVFMLSLLNSLEPN